MLVLTKIYDFRFEFNEDVSDYDMRICEQGRGGGDGEDAGNCGKRSMERGLLGETAKQQQACN